MVFSEMAQREKNRKDEEGRAAEQENLERSEFSA